MSAACISRLVLGNAIVLALTACSSQTQTTTAPAPAETKFAITDEAKETFAKPDNTGKTRSVELLTRGRAVIKEQGKAGAPQAITLFSEAIKENPRNADAYWELGWAQQITGDFDGALKSWETLKALDPKYPDLDTFTYIATARRGEKPPEPPPPPKKAPPRRADMKTDLAR